MARSRAIVELSLTIVKLPATRSLEPTVGLDHYPGGGCSRLAGAQLPAPRISLVSLEAGKHAIEQLMSKLARRSKRWANDWWFSAQACDWPVSE